MRKTFLRFISSAVVIAILFVNNMKVSAVGAPTENAPETVFDMGDTTKCSHIPRGMLSEGTKG